MSEQIVGLIVKLVEVGGMYGVIAFSVYMFVGLLKTLCISLVIYFTVVRTFRAIFN